MKFLFEKIDNSQLIVFRIFFGLLMVAECWGAIATGWVNETFVDVNMTFNFIGFDWTQNLLGETMIYIYVIMGILGLLITFGAAYRFATITFFILWGLTYLMQKSHYNNHYYLVWLISFFMAIVPANRFLALDTQFNSKLKSLTMPKWVVVLFMAQVSMVYFYAAVAKLYPGWLEDRFLPIRLYNSAVWFETHLHWEWFSQLLRNRDFSMFLSYMGIVFDFLIVPMLLFKPTRKIAFIGALIFHLFNSAVLHIGIFPYFALALCIFFFSPEQIRKWFLPFKGRELFDSSKYYSKSYRKRISLFLFVYIVWQLFLPVRHWYIPGDVLWTEEGHRMAWRMMLRARSGHATFQIKDPKKQKMETVHVFEYLKPHQINDVYTKPDMMWQFAKRLKNSYKEKGIDSAQVFIKNSNIRINDGPSHPFINDTVDIANEKWSYFGHQSWILPEPENYYEPNPSKIIKE